MPSPVTIAELRELIADRTLHRESVALYAQLREDDERNVRTLAARLSRSVPTILAATDSLIAHGYVRKKRGGGFEFPLAERVNEATSVA